MKSINRRGRKLGWKEEGKKEKRERERERNERNYMVLIMKDRGADQRWDDIGSMQNFSMTIMEAWSSYPTVSNSIWGKGG